MRRFLATLGILFMILSSSGLKAHAEQITNTSKPFLVTYKDGTAEKYSAEWVAELGINKSESGGPAKPLEGKFVDDRQCHWDITATVVRRLYFKNRSGESFEKKDMAVPHSVKFSNEGAGFKLIGLRSENCGDADGRFQSDVNDGRKVLQAQFPGIVDADTATIKAVMMGWPNVKSVQ